MTAPDDRRLLIVRLSAIGDVVHGLPVAMALRRHFPNACIGWVVEGRAGDLLAGHEAIDELFRVPRRWLRSPRAVWRLRGALRRFAPQVAIDLQGLTKSAIAARLSGAPRRIGPGGRDGRELSRLLNNVRVTPMAVHVIERNLQLLAPLGIASSHVEFGLKEPPHGLGRIKKYVAEANLENGFALINPGAGWPSKLWPTERFAAVARHLGQRGLKAVVAWAGHQELDMARAIVTGAPGQGDLAPQTSLVELAALARRARLFVSSDTGPLHIAAAVGTPCVGLFGPMPHERNGPYGPQHIAVQQARLADGSHGRRRADRATMQAISVDHVCAACDAILSRSQPAAGQRVA